MTNKELTKRVNNIMNIPKGFSYNNNYKLIEVKDKYCKLEGLINETSLNPYEIVHGGYIFGLADTAGGIAVATGEKLAVTSSCSINYISKAKGKKIIAEAKCLKQGKAMANCEVTIYNEEEKLIAIALIEYFYV